VEGIGSFAVNHAGDSITLLRAEIDNSPLQVDATIVGPPLMLALALQEVFCLHASAVSTGERAIVFLGGSGTGKSTLAAILDANEDMNWHLIVDDVLPAILSPSGPVAAPHFPQLKLAPEEPVDHASPEQIPLGSICLLDPVPQSDTVTLWPLKHREATMALLRHTMGTSIFSNTLLAAHLDFCAQVAQQIPVKRLVYPHTRDALKQVREILAADLEMMAAN
jgi:hypothetical protein